MPAKGFLGSADTAILARMATIHLFCRWQQQGQAMDKASREGFIFVKSSGIAFQPYRDAQNECSGLRRLILGVGSLFIMQAARYIPPHKKGRRNPPAQLFRRY